MTSTNDPHRLLKERLERLEREALAFVRDALHSNRVSPADPPPPDAATLALAAAYRRLPSADPLGLDAALRVVEAGAWLPRPPTLADVLVRDELLTPHALEALRRALLGSPNRRFAQTALRLGLIGKDVLERSLRETQDGGRLTLPDDLERRGVIDRAGRERVLAAMADARPQSGASAARPRSTSATARTKTTSSTPRTKSTGSTPRQKPPPSA